MTTDMTVSFFEETMHGHDTPQGTTVEMDISSSSSSSDGLYMQSFLVSVCILALVANVAMLISLFVHRQSARKTVNIFICNQTVLDAAAAFFAAVNVILNISGYFQTTAGVAGQLGCFLIENGALITTALYGSVYGLVVITAERYVKIVHPVAHRNHYRRWMTYVGVAVPWLIGLVTSAVQTMSTTRFVDGTCTTQVYPTKVALCATRVALFSWRFVIPLIIFVVCYWNIISAIRRQAKVASSHRDETVAGPSTSTVAAASDRPKPPSKAQKNVIKTMIVIMNSTSRYYMRVLDIATVARGVVNGRSFRCHVIVIISCFTICWMPWQFTFMAKLCGLQVYGYRTLHLLFLVIAMINLCANPFIYATGLYQFLRIKCVAKLRQLTHTESRVADTELV